MNIAEFQTVAEELKEVRKQIKQLQKQEKSLLPKVHLFFDAYNDDEVDFGAFIIKRSEYKSNVTYDIETLRKGLDDDQFFAIVDQITTYLLNPDKVEDALAEGVVTSEDLEQAENHTEIKKILFA